MLELREVEKTEITTLMDNYTDALASSGDGVKRRLHYRDGTIVPPLLAEHGLSLLIRVYDSGERHTVLLDAGWSGSAVIHNMREMGIGFEEIGAVVLSHGHMDHHGGLLEILKERSKPVPVIAHPDVFLRRRFLELREGGTMTFPVLYEEALRDAGGQVKANKGPYLLAGDFVLVTGEVDRSTDFEKGMTNAYAERTGKVERDYLLDDQAIVVAVRGKGLVVITGCSHSGIINTIEYAKKLSGIKDIYAIIGGFHLGGSAFEPIIERTLAELKRLSPEIICPMHCTGWKATLALATEMQERFVLNCVGTTLTL